ncbi:hypothetical protein ASF80_06450 [Microbacterium sp. Leaf159]|nr:hypothetical protein ASF80_06450 [Microbacterium sp. Leaf159]
MDQDSTSHEESIADADLVLRTRSGDAAAFGELWRRHYPSGMSVARSITSSIDPDDLVQESYTRIYQAIIKGGGPNGSFRAYLFTSIRNTAAAWGRSRRESAIDELDTVADPDSTEQAANEALDRSLTAQAFRSLPSRWQEVLWYTEIEQMKPQEAGPLLGMKAGAVSQLAFRAREGLREAWIQAHLRSAAPGSDCQWTIEHLGAYSRGNLSTRDHKRLELHLDECARCMIVAAEAKDVSKRLALVLLPLVLGVAGSAGYLATLQGGGTPIVALAAMPSGITQGAAVVAGGGTASGGVAAGAGGSAGGSAGGGAGGTGGATSGGIFSGVGALVGAGSAALVVAGVVAAATIIPGLAGANPAASLPSAGDSDSSSISSDVGPDEAMAEDKPVIVDDTEPEKQPEAPPVEAPVTPEPAEDTAPALVAPAAPVEIVKPAPPVEPGAPEEPTDPTDPVDPTDPTDPTDPAVPTTPIETQGASICVDDDGDGATHVSVPVLGQPGAEIEAFLGRGGGGDNLSLSDAGTGTVDLRPNLGQIILGTTVEIRYVTDAGPVLPHNTTLAGLGVTIDTVLTAPSCDGQVDEVLDETPADDPAPVDQTLVAPVQTEDPAPAETAPVEAQAPAEVAAESPAPVDAPATAPAPAPVEAVTPEDEARVDEPVAVADEAVPAL